MCVKWGKVNSAYFNVSNGVRQGGILSPKLFAIYVDDLSRELTLCNSGCYIDHQCMNHVMYADDICLMAPSAIGLQKMLDVCFDFSLRNDIMFNPVKSVCVTFKPKNCKLSCPSVIGYEPAGLTVHPPPPPRMIEGGFIFFVWVSSVTKIFSSKKKWIL